MLRLDDDDDGDEEDEHGEDEEEKDEDDKDVHDPELLLCAFRPLLLLMPLPAPPEVRCSRQRKGDGAFDFGQQSISHNTVIPSAFSTAATELALAVFFEAADFEEEEKDTAGERKEIEFNDLEERDFVSQ